jgi:transposase
MLVLWSTLCGVTREQTAAVVGLGRATVQRYLVAYRTGGLDGLRHWGVTGPVSDLAAFAQCIRNDLTATPVRTTAEARDRIEAITGLHRGLTQTRTFLAGLGFTWQRTRAVPVPPKSL